MNFSGIIIGLCTFLIIGVCHPLVIKAEYHLGKGCWWLFLLAGIGFAALWLFVESMVHYCRSGRLFFLLVHTGAFRTGKTCEKGLVPGQSGEAVREEKIACALRNVPLPCLTGISGTFFCKRYTSVSGICLKFAP